MVKSTTESTRYVGITQVNVNQKKLRKLSQAKIRQFMVDYERGDDFPPVLVEDCGDFFIVREGRHRYQAQLLAGYERIAVTVY